MGVATRGAFFAASVALIIRRNRESVIDTIAQMKLRENDGVNNVKLVWLDVRGTHKTMTRISSA